MSEAGFSSAVMVAAIGGAVSLAALTINTIFSGRRERISRQRREFAKAFAACIAYEEFPYTVRRRRCSAPEDERIRISSELSGIQRELAYYSAWLATQSVAVSVSYEILVTNLREIAGARIREAWLSPPVDSDSGMNMPDLCLGALKPLKEAYLHEVACHLSGVPRPVRCLARSFGHLLRSTR